MDKTINLIVLQKFTQYQLFLDMKYHVKRVKQEG